MKATFLSIAVFASLAIVSCETKTKKNQKEESKEHTVSNTENKAKEHKTWSYEGETSPEHWASLAGSTTCGGTHQSPINIIASDAVVGESGLKATDIHYQDETIVDNITNNGHSIQYNFKGGDNYVNFKGRRYDLAQFHFHSPSEHTINGIRYPLVMHMVHVSKEKDFVVFAVMIQEGKESKIFDFIEGYLPINVGETKEIGKPYNFNDASATSMEHFYYKGSLTTPPCTEAVNWFVFKEPYTVSAAQVKALATLMPKNNYRNEQPLNGRVVTFSK